MKKQIIKVGFDLDGVLLYNPARIYRPIIAGIKKYILKRDTSKFYYPKNKIEQAIWYFLHKSSVWPAPAVNELLKLIKKNKIKAFIISGRYESLKADFKQWIKKIDHDHLFAGYYYNNNNEQPHLFKEKIIKKLNLDIYVEDNWDIVNYLANKTKLKTKIFWIYNILDAFIDYKDKFASLSQVIKKIKEQIQPKKRLLIVTDFFHPHWTGIAKSLLYLIRALKNNLKIKVITNQYQKNLPKEEKIEQATIIRCPTNFSFSRTHFSFFLISKLVKLIPENDIVFINSPCTYILLAAILTKIFKKRLVIFHQGDLILPKNLYNWFIEKIFDFATHIACFLADDISTYTEDYAKHSRILKKHLKKFTLLSIPIFILKKREKTKIDEIFKNLKKEGHTLFGFAGRFVEEKGFDILLKAIPQIVEKLPKARFVFAGETQIKYENFFEKNSLLWRKVKPYLFNLGLLNDEELKSFYSKIDFLIVPSRSDCFNLVQAESMLFKTPVVASNIPGLRTLIKETGFGILFKPGSSISLTKIVISIVRKKDKIKKNSNKVLSFLDIDESTKKIVAFFTS